MPPRNFKRDRFAFELYTGRHPTDAYALAGYNASKASGPRNARRLACHPQVCRRIHKLFAEEWEFAKVQAARAMRERELVAFSVITDFYEPGLDADGEPTLQMKDLTKLPRALTAAIKTVRRTRFGYAITMRDKLGGRDVRAGPACRRG